MVVPSILILPEDQKLRVVINTGPILELENFAIVEAFVEYKLPRFTLFRKTIVKCTCISENNSNTKCTFL